MRARPEEVANYIDNIMKAVGSMRQGDVLSLAMEVAIHLATDDLRQHVQLTPTTVHEQRLDSPSIKALAKALHDVGIATPGLGSTETPPYSDEDVEALLNDLGIGYDDGPIPYTTVFMDDDEELHFPMKDD
jgi:hypothetical protein